MFIRYVRNTKKICDGTVLDTYDYEVNRNGVHFIYGINAKLSYDGYTLTRITFIGDIHLYIALFTYIPGGVYMKNTTHGTTRISYRNYTSGEKYDYIAKNRSSRGVPLQLVGVHHDLLRSLRAVSLV